MFKKKARSFNLSDDIVVSHANLTFSYLKEVIDKFSTLNSNRYGPEYIETLEGVIDKASSTLSDKFIISAQTFETNEIKKCKKLVASDLEDLKYYVDQAFGDNEAIIKEFQLDDISDYIINTDIFIGYISDLIVAVIRKKTELQKHGFTDELIAAISEGLGSLSEHRLKQKTAMNTRRESTQNRIAIMNLLWSHLVQLRDAASRIFTDDPVMRSRFDLPKQKDHSSDENKEDEEIEPIDLDEEISDDKSDKK